MDTYISLVVKALFTSENNMDAASTPRKYIVFESVQADVNSTGIFY